LQIKSYWDGEEGICTWQPQPYHIGHPSLVNGGILAAIIDCHATCTAVAAAYRVENRAITTAPLIACVMGSLNLTYLRPTPITEPLLLRATIRERAERKTLVTCTLSVQGEVCVRAEAVVVRVRTASGAGI
jgi:acyl-coenzyme A thioesterase PaaI-like protein